MNKNIHKSTLYIYFSIIRNVDGKIIQKYKHPRAVYGCDWSPNNRLAIVIVTDIIM